MTDKYIETKYGFAGATDGAVATSIIKVIAEEEVFTAGDILRIATLPTIAIIKKITIGCSALTGAIDNDLGIYKQNSGDVLDGDLLMDGQTFATASKTLDGLKDVSVANANKNLKDLFEAVNTTLTCDEQFVDIGLKINTANTATGAISIKIDYVI